MWWEAILNAYGLSGFVIAALMLANVYQYRQNQKLVAQHREALEKRIEDAQEYSDEYKDLARDIEKSVDLIVKMVRRNGG